MLIKLGIISHLYKDGTLRQFFMKPRSEQENFLVAYLDEYVSDDTSIFKEYEMPFIFMDIEDQKVYQNNFSNAEQKRLGPASFKQESGVSRFQHSWSGVPTSDRDLTYFVLALPKHAVFLENGLKITSSIAAFNQPLQYEIKVDEHNELLIIYVDLQRIINDRANRGLPYKHIKQMDFQINCVFRIDAEAFSANKRNYNKEVYIPDWRESEYLKEKNMHQEAVPSTEIITTQSSAVPAKPFFGNPYSAEAYLTEISKRWPGEFRELCIENEEAQPLINYITKEFIDDKKISDDDVQWLLLCAAYYGSLSQIKTLIQQDFVSAKQGTEKGNLTIMHIAALKGDTILIQEAKKMHFSIHKSASIGLYKDVTPIHCAIISGNTEALPLLDGRFSHVHYDLGNGATDYIELGWLSLAVYAGQLDMVKRMIEKYSKNLGQIAFVQGGFGGKALHIAVETFQQEILVELLAHEFFRNMLGETNTHGLTPFALAAQLGNIDAIKILRIKGAEINEAVRSGKFNSYTALHLAAEAGQHKAVQCLLVLGASYTATCKPIPKSGKSAKEYTAKALAAKSAKEAAQEAKNASEFNLRRYHIQKSEAYAAIENDLESFEIDQHLTQFSLTTDKKVIYKNLVFKGGGPKGMVYAGALLKLLEKWQDNNDLKDLSSIERVAGASAGAITAVLLALGISPGELRNFLTDKDNDPKQFLEGRSLDLLSSKPASEKLLEATKNAGWYALHPLQLGGLFLHLCKDDWLCTGDVFLNWIEQKIRAATGKEWCTFGELKNQVDSQKERKFRHLHVVTIRVTPNTQVEVLSSEDERYKDYTIAHAIRASMSIPIVFKPAELYRTVTNADGQRQLVKTNDGLYVDGGVLANYPLKVFDTAGYVYQGLYGFRDEQSKHFPVYNEATLGFYILPEKELADPAYTKPGKISMYRALQTLYSSAEDRVHEFEQAIRRSIAIENAGVTLYDFDLKPEQISALFQAGVQAVENSPLITYANRTATPLRDQQYATTTTNKDIGSGNLTGYQEDLTKK